MTAGSAAAGRARAGGAGPPRALTLRLLTLPPLLLLLLPLVGSHARPGAGARTQTGPRLQLSHSGRRDTLNHSLFLVISSH